MKRVLLLLLSLGCLGYFLATTMATTIPTAEASAKTSAKSAVLLDADSGRVLYEQNADEPLLIASITKIMTALVALERCPIDTEYTVQQSDMVEGSSMYLKPGETVTLRELLYGLMLVSGNDAALAVAHCVGGEVETFVDWMNEKAEELSLTNTSFANPNGLDHEDHYSSARGMAMLTCAALQNEVFANIVATKSITLGERTLVNHNKLLKSYEDCIGVKTGYTKAAGRTLVSAAERNGQTLIAVTLSDGNDWEDHRNLLNYGFSEFPMLPCVQQGEAVHEIAVKLGKKTTIPVIASEELYYPIHKSDTVTVTYEGYEAVAAPVTEGTVVGEIVVSVNGTEVGRCDGVLKDGTGLSVLQST